MTFAWNQASRPVDDAVARAMVAGFADHGGRQLDTARIYSGGDAEEMLGRVLRGADVDVGAFTIATKAHPSQPGGLSGVGIRQQLAASLKALHLERVDVLYLHQPDPEHDLVESLACVQELVQEGAISRYGMSNYNAVEVERCCQICAERGWLTPSFYQGLYNPLNRMVEEDLLPTLRRHGIAFIAFNPLAAGLLTGKHTQGGEVAPGRFRNNPNYLPRFYTEPNFAAVNCIRAACEEHGLGMVDATYSWLLQHSQLDANLNDGLLLGASTSEQLEQNVAACAAPPSLPPLVVAAFDKAWSTCRDGAFPYWRSYSKDQPGRETMHPGASYNAAKTR
eukprot:CAMPEP_0176060776 /NCGR_PEP_ID=MMETSP0120_2-20121206/30295_1 /TAXON_ID=160619 /ORGANISM="Kryptoperidinium foliaceum, Strain CCMP 1326" /LENGTH=335 /DNA_ID=CAMNT_0017394323 /DNA_START=30 /DNA_END=1037 /DNA_ORIENTATION=-